MGVQVKNNAYSTLASDINAVTTTINVAVGEGSRFPTAATASNTYFYATLLDTSNNIEVVKVTDRTTDTLTVVRGQDNTTARSFLTGDRIEVRVTSALLGDLPIRELETADYADASITSAKLAASGVIANTYGGLGTAVNLTINSKGQVTSAETVSGYVQRDQYDYTTTGAVQTWTKPSTGSLVRVQCWGGGGGGAVGASGVGGGGGGGGGYAERWFNMDELVSGTVVVANGGAGGVSSNSEGSVGGHTTFTSGSITVRGWRGGGGSANGTTTLGSWGGGGGGELESGTSATNSTAGKGGAIGGGHGGQHNSGIATTGSTARGTESVTDGDIPATPAWMTNDARSIYGGGGGGGGNTGNVTGSEATGGFAVWGGGGGGGGYNGTATAPGGNGGTSLYGGAGGAGSTSSTAASNGATPGGGGGGSEAGAAGRGGHGRCIITVY